MSYHFYLAGMVASIAPAAVPVLPNAPGIEITDFAGTVTQDASKIRLLRPIADDNGYAHVAPGARIRLGVASPVRHAFILTMRFTSMVTRRDSYNPVGSIFVDGALSRDFTGPGSWTINTPHPAGDVEIPLVVEAGVRTVEIVLPYLASVDLIGITRAAEASIIAPSARTTDRTVFVGDSIVQGFNAPMMRKHWTFLLCEAAGWQHINLGYGGRDLRAPDLGIAAAVGAARTITDYGINDGFQGTSSAVMQAKAEAALAAFRQGDAAQLLYWINIFDCTHSALLTPAATLRTAIAAAFAANAGARDVLIPGGTANGLPAASESPDLIHPTDLMSIKIAATLRGLIP